MRYGRPIALVLVTSALAVATAVGEPPAATKSTPPAAAKAAPAGTIEKAAQAGHLKIAIAKDTTGITEPLRPDGYPDYYPAINQRCTAGVTPENNAAVLCWKAFGPWSIKKEHRAEYFRRLGMQSLPDKGDYFRDWYRFFKENAVANPPKRQDYREELEQMTARPWSRHDHPLWTKWLEVNEKPLALLVEASKRSKFYDPLIQDAEYQSLYLRLTPGIMDRRDAVEALRARAMLHAGEDRLDDAISDILAAHRLARFSNQEPSWFEALGLRAADSYLANDRALLKYADLNAEQFARMRKELASLPPLPSVASVVDRYERLVCMDAIILCATQGPAKTKKNLADKDKQLLRRLLAIDPSANVDWNTVARTCNSWCDRVVSTFRLSPGPARQQAVNDLEEELKNLRTALLDGDTAPQAASPEALSAEVGDLFTLLLVPDLLIMTKGEDQAIARQDLTKIAYALAAYNRDFGSYPASLTDLVSMYLPQVPDDVFCGAPFVYRREGTGYLLYSVGMNGKDEGGKGYEDRKNNESWDDIAVRFEAKPPVAVGKHMAPR